MKCAVQIYMVLGGGVHVPVFLGWVVGRFNIAVNWEHNATFGIARKFVQTTGKLVRTSGTRLVCFTGSDVLGCKKQTTMKVNKNNCDLASTPLEK